MSNSEKIKEIPGFTIKSLTFSVIFCIAILLFTQYGEYWGNTKVLRRAAWDNDWPAGALNWFNCQGYNFAPIVAWFFIPILITALLPKKQKFTMQELAFIYAMVGPAALIAPKMAKHAIYGPWRLFTNPILKEWSFKYVRNLMPGSTLEEATQILLSPETGGVPVPWAQWTPVIGIYMLYYISFYFFMTLGGALLKKMWVDYESLTFPFARAITEMIQMSYGENKTPLFKSGRFWIGALVSLVFGLLQNIDVFFKGAPSLANPNYPTFWFSVDLYTPNYVPFAIPFIGFEPWMLGLGLLLPVDVLLSYGLLGYIIWEWIYPLYYGAIGLFNPTNRAPHFFAALLRTHRFAGILTDPTHPLRGVGAWNFVNGMVLGVALFPLVRNRSLIINSIKNALGKSNGSEEATWERRLWIGWLITGALAFVSLMLFGLAVHYALISLVWFAINWLGMARLNAETGTQFGGSDNVLAPHAAPYRFLQMAFRTDRAFVYAYSLPSGVIAEWPAQGIGNDQSLRWTMSSYKVAAETNTKWTSLIPGQLLAIAIGVIVTIPFYLWLVYNNGYLNRVVPHMLTQHNENIVTKAQCHPYQEDLNIWNYGTLIGGILVSSFLIFARVRFGGPFQYISAAGLAAHPMLGGIWAWFPYTIALVIQKVARRIGGAQYYERNIIPLAVGLMVGLGLDWLVMACYWLMLGTGAI